MCDLILKPNVDSFHRFLFRKLAFPISAASCSDPPALARATTGQFGRLRLVAAARPSRNHRLHRLRRRHRRLPGHPVVPLLHRKDRKATKTTTTTATTTTTTTTTAATTSAVNTSSPGETTPASVSVGH